MSSKAAKQLLRREMKQKLKLLTNEEKQSQSAQVTQKLFGKYFLMNIICSILIFFIELRQYQSAKSVALYLRFAFEKLRIFFYKCCFCFSMDDEINTDNILQDIFTQQKKCYIPK